MKTKLILLSLTISLGSPAYAISDGAAALIGIAIGAHLRPREVIIEREFYPDHINRRPVVIYRDQLDYYDETLHGYCAPYRDTMYAECMGRAKRRQLDEAYNRGFNAR